MIKAFKKFKEENGNESFKLLIAGGDQGGKKEILDVITQIKFENEVFLLNYITNKQKQYFYKHCEASILLGKSEGFGIPVIESMYYKKPIIVSNQGALPEIVGSAGIKTESDVRSVAIAMRDVMSKQFPEKIFADELNRFDRSEQIKKLISAFK
uniref:Glycosyltransferase group 1 n=2 Tax=Hafnia TaxID=568 RepID=A0A172WZS6_HAFAL|nr:glycosyltransferase group 1 [Hafnia alvei]